MRRRGEQHLKETDNEMLACPWFHPLAQNLSLQREVVKHRRHPASATHIRLCSTSPSSASRWHIFGKRRSYNGPVKQHPPLRQSTSFLLHSSSPESPLSPVTSLTAICITISGYADSADNVFSTLLSTASLSPSRSGGMHYGETISWIAKRLLRCLLRLSKSRVNVTSGSNTSAAFSLRLVLCRRIPRPFRPGIRNSQSLRRGP